MRKPIQFSLGDLLRARAGSVSIEFALLATVLLVMLGCATDLALGVWTKTKVAEAARVGAQYAAAHGWSSSAITSAVTSATPISVVVTPTSYCGCPGATGVTSQTCGATCSAGGTAGTYVSVQVVGLYRPILASLWGALLTAGAMNLTAESTTRIN